MVLSAVLRDPALDPEQAARRLRVVWLYRYLGVLALARYLARQIGALPAAVPPVLLAVRDRLCGLGLARHKAAGRHLRDPGAHPYLLLFRILPDRAAAARHFRENQAAAEFDFGIGLGRESVSGAMIMTKHRTIIALTLAGAFLALNLPAFAQEAAPPPPPRVKWSFAGPFGKYDEAQLQRGFKIYKEVCANCHSMDMLTFGNLADPGGPGFNEAQAETVAADYKIKDLDDKGQPTERSGRLADHFPAPFPNALAAAANYGVAPPDMS